MFDHFGALTALQCEKARTLTILLVHAAFEPRLAIIAKATQTRLIRELFKGSLVQHGTTTQEAGLLALAKFKWHGRRLLT